MYHTVVKLCSANGSHLYTLIFPPSLTTVIQEALRAADLWTLRSLYDRPVFALALGLQLKHVVLAGTPRGSPCNRRNQ
jgi:hypothetical protein